MREEGAMPRWQMPVIITALVVMAVIQVATGGVHEAHHVIYLGYFIPILISAMYLSRPAALAVAAAASAIYVSATILHLFFGHSEGFFYVPGHVGLFFALGFALSSFRLRLSREKEKTVAAERERADRLKLMLDISIAVSSSLDLNKVLQILAAQTVDAVKVTYCRILLLEEGQEGNCLRVAAAHPIREMGWDPAVNAAMPLEELPGYKKALETRDVVVVRGTDDISLKSMTRRQRQLLSGAQSQLLYPLVVNDAAVGIICIGEQRAGERSPLGPEKVALCQTIANVGAVAAKHAMTHRALEDAFVGTVRSLAQAIDAKDRHTHGHSERVACYALMAGRALGMDENSLWVLESAGYLHDVGKIGISDSVLKKSQRLSSSEWRLMKSHPVTSNSILEPAGLSASLKAAVLHHHERFDGKGYPDGLAGEAIPLEARILAVADAYEAMTSDRPYRKALSHQEAVAELRRNSGVQFDPAVVEAFLKALEETAPPVIERAAG